MKKSTVLILFIILTLISATALIGGQKSWKGTVSTTPTWSQSGNWTPSGVPASTDTVTVGDASFTGANQPSINTSVTIAALTFGSSVGVTLDLTNGGSGTLTVIGDLNMVQSQGSGTVHALNVNNRSVTVQGSVLGIGPNGGSSSTTSDINISTGTLSITGSLTINLRGTLAFSGAGTMNLGGNFNSNNGGTFTQSTSIVNCNGTNAQSISGGTYNILKSNNTAGVTLAAASTVTTLTIGDVTANSVFSDGGFVITSTGTLNLTSGTYQLGSATVGTAFPGFTARNISSGTTIEYASGVAQAVSSTPLYQNLKISGTGTKTAGGNLIIAGDLNVDDGTLSLGTNTANRTTSGGTLTVGSGATLSIGGTNGIPGNYATHAFDAASTINYGGTNQTISSDSYGGIGVSGSGTKTLAGNLTINGNLTVFAGTLDPAGFSVSGSGTNTLSVTGTLLVDASTFAGNYLSFETRTFNAGSTVNYKNANPTIDGGITYQNLAFSGSGTAGASSDLTLQGNLTNTGGGTLNFGSSNVILSANNTQSITGFTTTGDFSFTKTGGTATMGSAMSVGSLTPSGSGGTLSLGASLTHTVTGGVTITAGTLTLPSTSTLNVGRNWSRTGTFSATPGLVVLNGSSQSISGSTTTFGNLTISSSGTVTLAAITTVTGGNLSVTSGIFDLSTFTCNRSAAGGVLSVSNGATLKIGGTNGIPTNYSTHTFGASSTVEYSGTAQSVSGESYGNLTISGSATKTLAASCTPAGILTVNAGTFDLSTFTINRASSGGTLTVVNGAVLKIGGTNGFPSNYTTHTLGATSTIEYGGTTQTIAVESYGHLTVSGSLTKTFAGATTILGDLTVSAGTLNPGGFTVNGSGTNTLNVTGTLQVDASAFTGNYSGFETVTLNASSTVDYSGSGSQTIDNTLSYQTLTHSGSGTGTSGGNLTIAVNLTESGGTFDLSTFTANRTTSGGTLTVGSGATLKIGGTNSFPSNYTTHTLNVAGLVEYSGTNQTVTNETYGNLTLSGSGTKTMPGTTMTIAGTFTTSGTASATAGAIINFASVVLGSGTTFNASTFAHTVAGDWTNNGGTFTPSTSTVTFNSTTAGQSINGTAASQTFSKIAVNKTGQILSVGGSTTTVTVDSLLMSNGTFTAPATLNSLGNFRLQGGTLTAGSSTTVGGNWINNGGTFTQGSGTVTFNGTGAQAINGSASSQTFNDVIINKSVGTTLTVSASTTTLTVSNFTETQDRKSTRLNY